MAHKPTEKKQPGSPDMHDVSLPPDDEGTVEGTLRALEIILAATPPGFIERMRAR